MTEKRFIYNKLDIVGNFEENELKLYEIDNNPSNDLDESNLFYVYSNSEVNIEHIVDKLNTLTDENEELKKILRFLRNDNATDILNVLNSQENQIWKLKKENEQLKQRNNNQYNQLIELWKIIEEENWEKLIAMKKQLKEDEERLQREWKCYE